MTAQHRTQQLLLVLIGSIALLGAYLIGTHANTADATPATTAAPDPGVHGFSAPGTGSVPGVPDELSFSVSISRHSGDSVDAMNRTGAAVRKLRKALVAAGVLPRDITTSGVNLEPTYQYSSSGRSIPTGFDFSEDLRVLVRQLPQAGRVLSTATVALDNGGQVSDVSMQVGDRQRANLLKTARARAIKDSRAAAQSYADAVGSKVGAVLYVEETTAAPQPVYYDGAFNGLANLDLRKAASVPISAGRQDVTVQVKVRWAIG